MRLFRTRPLAFTLTLFAAFTITSGCSSSTTHIKVVEVKPDADSIKAYAIPVQMESAPIDKRTFDFFADGNLMELEGNLSGAAQFYKAALQIDPTSYEIRYSLAEVHYRLHNFEAVLEILSTINPQDIDVYNLRAGCYRALSRQEEAKTAYYKVIELDPDNTNAFSYLAGIYRSEQNVDSTLWGYKNMVRVRADNYRLRQEYGRLLTEAGRLDEAKEAFAGAIELQPGINNILSYAGLGEIYTAEGKLDSAASYYKAGLEADTASLFILRALTSIYISQDSVMQALYYSKRLANQAPEDRYILRNLATIYYAADSLEQSEKIFSKLVESGERHPGNHYYLGRIAFLQEDYSIAASEFTVLTQLADTVAESWVDLASAYRQLKDPEKEILTYQTGLNHMKSEESALRLYFAMGAAYEQDNQFDKATEVFEEIIARSPKHAQALNYLGYMLADKGERLDYALKLIEQAIQLSPENAAFLDSYGWVFYRLGKYDDALIQLRKAVSIGSDPVIFDHLGDALKATGQIDEARLWWEKAYELQPENDSVREKLGL